MRQGKIFFFYPHLAADTLMTALPVLALSLIAIFANISGCAHASSSAPGSSYQARVKQQPIIIFTGLYEKLRQDGFDEQRLRHYYTQPRVSFEVEHIALFFQHNEATLNYDQFLTKQSIHNALIYMKKQKPWMQKARALYQVEPEIITAILLVETRLGEYLGKHSTLNTLSSMAALTDPVARSLLWDTLKKKKTTMGQKAFNARADQKARWAYEELKAFLKYSEQENIADPSAILGSYAGAIGIPQFMPSNVVTMGVDGDNDGRVNLFTHPDAILSVAGYLHRYGWRPGLDEKKAYRALFYYNRSKYYVDTLLKIAQALKSAA